MFTIETKRLIIKEFTLDMAYDVHINSLDIDNRRFVPDEVFETIDEAKETIEFLIQQYDKKDGPFVYPIFIKEKGQSEKAFVPFILLIYFLVYIQA